MRGFGVRFGAAHIVIDKVTGTPIKKQVIVRNSSFEKQQTPKKVKKDVKLNLFVDDNKNPIDSYKLEPFNPSPRARAITEHELLGALVRHEGSCNIDKLKLLKFGNVLNSKNHPKQFGNTKN